MNRYFGYRSHSYLDIHQKRILVISTFSFLAISSALVGILWPSQLQPIVTTPIVQSEPQQTASRPVLLPLKDIQPFTLLEPKMFKIENQFEAQVPEYVLGAYSDIQAKSSRSFLPAGRPVYREAVTDTLPNNRNRIPKGFRVMAIKGDALSTVAGDIKPDDFVDVVLITNTAGRCLLAPQVQNVKVYSVNGDINYRPSASITPSTVSLLLLARDANQLQLAQTIGMLRLHLRGEDLSVAPGPEARIDCESLIRPMSPDNAEMGEGSIHIDGKEYEFVPGEGLRLKSK